MDASTLIARLETATASFRNLERQLADPDVASDPKRLETIARERSRLEPLVLDYEALQTVEGELDQSRQLLKESRGDTEMECLAQDELDDLSSRHEALVQKLTLALLPRDPRDERSVMLEIRAGAGGDEACLWAGDLARMYERYSQKLGWSVQPVSSNEADLGGFRELILSVKGDSVFSQLKFEAGVHRVQRVPATESQGRVHTSTATVAVMPEADAVEVELDPKDLGISTARSGGAGGQNVNRWKPRLISCINQAESGFSVHRNALSFRTASGRWRFCGQNCWRGSSGRLPRGRAATAKPRWEAVIVRKRSGLTTTRTTARRITDWDAISRLSPCSTVSWMT